MRQPVSDLVIEQLASDVLDAETREQSALSTLDVYREMLSVTLDLWRADRQRLHGATQRLRQVMGNEPWRAEELS